MINISNDIFGYNLLKQLYDICFTERENSSIITRIFIKLCETHLSKISDISFNEEEIEALKNENIDSLTNNLELKARWLDYKSNETDKVTNTIAAYELYDNIYNITNELEYYIRAIEIVKSKKGIFINQGKISFIISKTDSLIPTIEGASDLKELLGNYISIGDLQKIREKHVEHINILLDKSLEEFRFEDAITYIDCLYIVEELTLQENKIKRAEIYELDGDYQVFNKEENTCYPNLSNSYLSALKEVQSIPDCKELQKRIRIKYQKEILEFANMVSRGGIPNEVIPDQNKIYERVINSEINDFNSAMECLLTFPLTTQEKIDNYMDMDKKASSSLSRIADFYSGKHMLSEKGTIIGKSKGDKVIEESARRYMRRENIAYIKAIKSILDIYSDTRIEDIQYLIDKSKSKFIPSDREYLFVQGLYFGFKNDYISASHILIPQIENSLKHIASLNNITISKFENEIQHDNTLGGILEKVKDVLDIDLWVELNDFLINTTGGNFRNNICHGLIHPVEIQYWGVNLWWLTLKMVVFADHLFKYDDNKI